MSFYAAFEFFSTRQSKQDLKTTLSLLTNRGGHYIPPKALEPFVSRVRSTLKQIVNIDAMRGDSLVLAEEVLLQDTTIISIWESWFASLPLEKQCSTKVSNELREDFTIKVFNSSAGCRIKTFKMRYTDQRSHGAAKLLLREGLKCSSSRSTSATAARKKFTSKKGLLTVEEEVHIERAGAPTHGDILSS